MLGTLSDHAGLGESRLSELQRDVREVIVRPAGGFTACVAPTSGPLGGWTPRAHSDRSSTRQNDHHSNERLS